MTTTVPGIVIDTVATGELVVTDGTNFSFSGTPLVRYCEHNVVLVNDFSYSVGSNAVELPTDCEIGDVFEVYLDVAFGISCGVFPPDGESFGYTNSAVNYPILIGTGCYCRKLTSSSWGVILGPLAYPT
jgi:hypothetical protein